MRRASRSTLATAVFLTLATLGMAQSSDPSFPSAQATPDLNPRPPSRGEIGQKPGSPRPPETQPTAVTTPAASPGAERRGRTKRRTTPAPTSSAPQGTPTPAAHIPAFRTDPRQPLFVVAAIEGVAPAPSRRPWEERNTTSWILFGVLVAGLGGVTIRMLRYRRRLEISALLTRLRDELRKDRRRLPRRDAALLKHP